MNTHPRKAIFVDFDGTIVIQDTAQVALDRFGDPEWIRIDEAYERGEMTFEESLRQEFAMLKAPEEVIINELSRSTELRPNFGRLVDYCQRQSIPLTVLSGGLDFCIRHFLNQTGWLKFVGIYSPTSKYTQNGYAVTFPPMFAPASTNFKDDLVRHERKNGSRAYFVGNGFGDFSAAKESDVVFAIKGSRLAELCREHSLPHTEIDDFREVIEALSKA
jgi:2,3-diketo-5-methylthio-1-phosphopentane phosphatase